MTSEQYTCDVCMEPILDGEEVHGLFWNEENKTGRHYKCTAKVKLQSSVKKFEESMSRAQAALANLKNKIGDKS